MAVAPLYVMDENGKPQAVQLSIKDWKKLTKQLRKQEQTLALKRDLETAFAEVELMQAGKIPKVSLKEFLDEL